MLNELRKKYVKYTDQITIIEASYLDYQFEVKTYDYVIPIQSLHHMLREDRVLLYKRIYNSLGDRGTFIEGDYIVYTKDEENQHINDARKLGLEKGIINFHDYHIDIPCTKETQRALYQTAGFTRIKTTFDKDYAILCECTK